MIAASVHESTSVCLYKRAPVVADPRPTRKRSSDEAHGWSQSRVGRGCTWLVAKAAHEGKVEKTPIARLCCFRRWTAGQRVTRPAPLARRRHWSRRSCSLPAVVDTRESDVTRPSSCALLAVERSVTAGLPVTDLLGKHRPRHRRSATRASPRQRAAAWVRTRTTTTAAHLAISCLTPPSPLVLHISTLTICAFLYHHDRR